MRDYELTLVINPDVTSENQKKLIAKIKKLIEDSQTGGKGKINKTDEWGKKDFSYPIAKKTFGYYFWFQISLPEETVLSLNKKLKLEEDILRYLLVKGEKNGTKVTK